jgi:hypothetical protein
LLSVSFVWRIVSRNADSATALEAMSVATVLAKSIELANFMETPLQMQCVWTLMQAPSRHRVEIGGGANIARSLARE